MSYIKKNLRPSFLLIGTLSLGTSDIFSNRSSYRQRSASHSHWITPLYDVCLRLSSRILASLRVWCGRPTPQFNSTSRGTEEGAKLLCHGFVARFILLMFFCLQSEVASGHSESKKGPTPAVSMPSLLGDHRKALGRFALAIARHTSMPLRS